ncbi:hypothetical protein L598_002700000340 [Mesorhizobium sp. J18]|uniref:permease prefix domain 1-containing protein n=1 Tax=Mesorhizobium sp. J18 TaxID=935263 RepID=UPI00119BFB31|nr:permease prefix domain 1-containing protein [Mesorhizobium sp. J18]TWG96304.1 hypothetical protein L598_002700000340 [Mesorhizobium sp. J18]
MRDLFGALEERLLRSGVRPSSVRRYLLELHDHVEDVTEELRLSGLPEHDARRRAIVRLGDIEALAQPMEKDRRFHSWAGRAPWAVYLLAPLAGCAAVTALIISVLISQTGAEPVPSWFEHAGITAEYLVGGGLSALSAWLITIIAFRQRSNWIWPAAGLGLSIVWGAVFDFSVVLAPSADTGALEVGLAILSPIHVLKLAIIASVPALVMRRSQKYPVS